ncbi:MAG: 4-(cytidine 5'-diphospho)-2-C-methyl-D-erythritol kinase, partial [Ignavibacteria bacterium RBG_13_36_8]
FYPIHDLFDTLIIEKSDYFSFSCRGNLHISDDSNLVIKAVRLLEDITKQKLNVKIILEKNIPIGGGLGGGSSDAAATLLSLNKMFEIGFDYNRLLDLALELGSDVPFFLNPKPSIGKSRGEVLEEINFKMNGTMLIINPNIHISTKEAFQNIIPREPEYSYENIVKIWNENPSRIKQILRNDFEKNIFHKYSVIEQIKKELYKSGAIYALMSGSGSTVFGIFNDRESALIAINNFPNDYFKFIHLPG